MTPCSRPILKNCSGEGRTECRTEYETSCSATYPAPDSAPAPAPASCVKLPVSFCGRGCVTAAGEEQCSEKTTDVLREVPGHTHDILNIESILTKSQISNWQGGRSSHFFADRPWCAGELVCPYLQMAK